MSASLVGSEMCIRDRRRRRAQRSLGRSRSRSPCLRRASQPCAGGGAPVSYTHLTLPTICSV
eukprot:195897-Alexandrium_andersonii.AAC.1